MAMFVSLPWASELNANADRSTSRGLSPAWRGRGAGAWVGGMQGLGPDLGQLSHVVHT